MSKPQPPAWYLAPVFSRGEFSPRLLLAWQTFYLMCWVVVRWQSFEPRVLNGILIQAADIVGIVTILAGIVVAALGLGTYQKIQLGKGDTNSEGQEQQTAQQQAVAQQQTVADATTGDPPTE